MVHDASDRTIDGEHVPTAHPLRTLMENHWYLDGFVEKGGMALLLMDGLLLVPLIMAAFFYPVPVLMGTGLVLLLVLAIYESVVIWKRRHPARS